MNNTMKKFSLLFSAALLAACGGGSGGGENSIPASELSPSSKNINLSIDNNLPLPQLIANDSIAEMTYTLSPSEQSNLALSNVAKIGAATAAAPPQTVTVESIEFQGIGKDAVSLFDNNDAIP